MLHSKILSRGLASASVVRRSSTVKDISICFFDSRPFWTKSFDEYKESFGAEIKYVGTKLSTETAVLAQGCQAACIFVNDQAGEAELRALKECGVDVLALRCAGFNNVDLKVAQELGISVSRVPSYSPHAVAEFALTLMMALNRKVARSYARTRSGNFSLSGLVGWDVHGKTVGVIGTGKIGSNFARIVQGMGCRVLCQDAYENTDLKALPNVEYVELSQLLAQSDVISMHAPLNTSTDHLINDDTIALMKTGVIIINTSRGKLIDTRCLIKGLKSGKIGGAGLDVYEGESQYFFQDRSDENIEDEALLRLLSFNNVILTSHQSFLTNEALSAIAQTTLQNVSYALEFGQRCTGGTSSPRDILLPLENNIVRLSSA